MAIPITTKLQGKIMKLNWTTLLTKCNLNMTKWESRNKLQQVGADIHWNEISSPLVLKKILKSL